jgi:hypothetical protein
MKLRAFVKKLRLRPLHGDGERPIDNVDATSMMSGGQSTDGRGHVPSPAPTNWVPSQQDERPRH